MLPLVYIVIVVVTLMIAVLIGQFKPNRRNIDIDYGREGNLDDDI